ncbi:hypothetical protein BBJ28_00001216 [Nothophytophthora sp. Chile5]|nr:hypothetical protein BBJ28_00001216 [Nothophytophthora sp. Chile5]
MSAEYALRMEALERHREELCVYQGAIEKRIALREATAAEFSAVALQSYKQRLKTLRASTISARKRNEEFMRSLRATQKQVQETSFRLKNDQSANNALLEQEKARYHRKIEQIYPAWQEQLQRLRVQVLRELEDKKHAMSHKSLTEKLSQVDRVKALGALIGRVEEGAAEGDAFSGSCDTGSSSDSKRELLKMAVSGRKAQIAFFGSDVCFELVLDILRDIGPVLFPPKAFEGIMNDQKIRKLHQQNKGKELGNVLEILKAWL